ncbi:Hypothetical protein CpATCC19410_0002 [Corynebacterium pseudotuberculosis]|nr:Hypothetical protein CpATCC19410_0002 [Corynebacterium pseudotuberculosis]
MSSITELQVCNYTACITLWTTFKIFVTVRKGKIKLPPTVFWEAVLFRD